MLTTRACAVSARAIALASCVCAAVKAVFACGHVVRERFSLATQIASGFDDLLSGGVNRQRECCLQFRVLRTEC
jgi:hypothetical protein